jgi:NhaP-type Na+/H+ or K+/H+ antiporter
VLGPLLDFIRPSKTVNSVLKWEGTLADPIGATLGVVVCNAIIAGHAKVDRGVAGFLLSIVIGAEFGLAGVVLVLIWVHWFKPTQSQAVPGTLMFVVAMVVKLRLLRRGQRLRIDQLAALGEPMVHLALELDVRRRILRRPGADELGRALRRCVVLQQHELHLSFSQFHIWSWGRSR